MKVEDRPLLVFTSCVVITLAYLMFVGSVNIPFMEVHTYPLTQIIGYLDFAGAAIYLYSLAQKMETTVRYQPDQNFLYLVGSGELYKIGITTNLDNRIKSLRTASPWEVKLVHSIKASNARDLEKALHKRFSPKRLRGEWFQLDDNDIAYIKGLKGMFDD